MFLGKRPCATNKFSVDMDLFGMRTIFIFASTAFSLFIIMLVLNIITVDEAISILNLSPNAANAFKQVITRIQEVSQNILHIISQLMQKLFGWSGVDVDLNKIHVDVNQNPSDAAGK